MASAPPLESVILKQIAGWLDLKSIVWWRVPLGPVIHGGVRKKNPMKGFPDLAGMCPGQTGRLFVIEAKRPNVGKFSGDQLKWRAKLEASGALFIEARSVDDVINAFLELCT